MPDLDPADVQELDRLCDDAGRVVEANRHLSIREAHPAVSIALAAIRARLLACGVEDDVAQRTVDRWFITRRSITHCLAVEADPPYPLIRAVPGVARTNPPGDMR